MGVIDHPTYNMLDRVVDPLTPAQVWLGYDYTDPLRRNFIATDDGRLRIIDVESLRGDYLLGSGVAKARLVWMEPYQVQFFGEMKKFSAPDFEAYLPFVELHFLTQRIKISLLHGKDRLVDPSLLNRFKGLA